jgi:hypothetical protein
MLRKIVIILLLAETIHKAPSELIKDILLKLQENNIFITDKEYESIFKKHRAGFQEY